MKKTTLNLPEDLMKEVKIRAIEENQTLQETVAWLLRKGLEFKSGKSKGRRVQFPIIDCSPAPPGKEITPEKAAEILLLQEVHDHDGSL
ncbi:MAG: antitoxin [Candidatus Eremiobacteraeota bacterium]|nr:antitoxin [Candidatus Eremiobacteraeota bacterium]